MAGIFALSSTAGSNTSIGGVSVAEGMSPANVNDAIRALCALIATSFSDSAIESFFNGSAALPVTKGGTGSTTAPNALASLGGLAATYRDLPVTTQVAAFSLTDAMRGTLQRYTGGAAALTINPNSTTDINDGGVIVILNRGSGALTTAKGVGVSLYIAGQTTNANVTIAQGGYCALLQSATDEWVAVGAGIS